MDRFCSLGRAPLDPTGRYSESLRCFCTRLRVSTDTSARSLSTFDTVATDTPAAPAISARVVRRFATAASGLNTFGRFNTSPAAAIVIYTPKLARMQLLTPNRRGL